MGRKILIAQGEGFYGCAIVTTELSWEHLVLGLLSKRWDVIPILGADQRLQQLTIETKPDCLVVIKEFDGEAQPRPVLIFDTGHSDLDVAMLQGIAMQVLNDQHIDTAFVTFTKREDWKEVAVKYGLDTAFIEEIAKKRQAEIDERIAKNKAK